MVKVHPIVEPKDRWYLMVIFQGMQRSYIQKSELYLVRIWLQWISQYTAFNMLSNKWKTIKFLVVEKMQRESLVLRSKIGIRWSWTFLKMKVIFFFVISKRFCREWPSKEKLKITDHNQNFYSLKHNFPKWSGTL